MALSYAAALAFGQLLNSVPTGGAPSGVPPPGPLASAAPVYSRAAGKVLDASELGLALAASVVLAGETHDDAEHHRIQAAVLELMADAGGPLTLALEMLDVTHQAALDRYASGAMSEAEFAALWRKAWGFDFELYRPVFEAARRRGARLAAVNLPREVLRKAASRGLGALTPEERALVAAEVGDASDPDYLAYLRRVFDEAGHGDFQRYVFAMQIWNETMAENLLKERAAGRRVLLIAGLGHVLYRAGIADGVRRRSPAEPQAVVLPFPESGPGRPLPELTAELGRPGSEAGRRADLFWLRRVP